MPIYTEQILDKKSGIKIDKLVDGKKQYYIRTYVEDEFGNKKQITRHNKNWIGREGQKEAEWEEVSLQKKKYNKYEKLTLNDLSKEYFKYIEKKLKPSTVRKNKDNYHLHIQPFLGRKKILDLTNKDILDFHKYLDDKENVIKSKNSKRTTGKYKLSISFKQSIHVTLVSLLNFGCKYFNLNKNVASIVGNFRKSKGSLKNEINFLTKNEFDEFIKFEINDIYKDFFTLLFFTGMRRGELLALTIHDIDFSNNEININKSINPKNGKESTDPKTNRSNRKIKMLNIVNKIFQKYKNTNTEIIFGLSKIKLTTLQRKCDVNCKKAKINKNIRIHDFRHSFASMCIFNGIPIEIISEYLGHESISTTLNTYAHLYPNSQNKLIWILDKQDQKQDREK